ncbi:NTP transferase domain-containing protein [Anaerococcus sp. AGMB00486]|uniref:NTP transferase domain-containing protein n=2 Tax=Anaerococcus TaxID=165779 RepID=A0ABX2N9K3_9FIRM|nr:MULTISPECIES: NTP transferase domain-containing protein [Anaerococcus]MSS78501.1 NTP transferase domain-containing protein [Anaerococcus porci]NVF11358.1 NTP transferase domain-containing protein [Anaerococcus faecalis]
MRVDNAIILAAGMSSRFAPLSFEKPKALIEVKGEILIERQIRQLKEAGVKEIIIVTGYKADRFSYLEKKFSVKLVYNEDYLIRNNNSSIYAVRDYLGNSYICSSDNYFLENPFEIEVDDSFYSSVYVEGYTDEWCIDTFDDGLIKNVKIGGKDSWIMLGYVFWSNDFSKKFISILKDEYDKEETFDKLWESIYIEHIDDLNMYIHKHPKNIIFEFDSLDELREFDNTYISDTRSNIIKNIAFKLKTKEKDIINIRPLKDKNKIQIGFTFEAKDKYRYYYGKDILEKI